MCVRGHVYMCVRGHVYMCVRGHVYMCVRGHVYMCVRGHVYMCVRGIELASVSIMFLWDTWNSEVILVFHFIITARIYS
jgi:hypothetical protein